MDKVESLIREIETRYQALCAAALPTAITPVPFYWGGRAREEAKSNGRVTWQEPGGNFSLEGRVGGNTGHIGSQVARLNVVVWHNTLENARNTLHNVILATRQQARGPNVNWRGYEIPTEEKPEYAKNGALIVAQVEVTIPISAQVVPEAPVENQDHSVVVGGIAVC